MKMRPCLQKFKISLLSQEDLLHNILFDRFLIHMLVIVWNVVPKLVVSIYFYSSCASES